MPLLKIKATSDKFRHSDRLSLIALVESIPKAFSITKFHVIFYLIISEPFPEIQLGSQKFYSCRFFGELNFLKSLVVLHLEKVKLSKSHPNEKLILHSSSNSLELTTVIGHSWHLILTDLWSDRRSSPRFHHL